MRLHSELLYHVMISAGTIYPVPLKIILLYQLEYAVYATSYTYFSRLSIGALMQKRKATILSISHQRISVSQPTDGHVVKNSAEASHNRKLVNLHKQKSVM